MINLPQDWPTVHAVVFLALLGAGLGVPPSSASAQDPPPPIEPRPLIETIPLDREANPSDEPVGAGDDATSTGLPSSSEETTSTAQAPTPTDRVSSPSVDLKKAPVPVLPPAQTNYEVLEREIRKALDGVLDPARVYVYVEDAHAPVVVFNHHGDDRVPPGPALQLVTTAAALDGLGANFRYRTMVRFSGELVGNAVQGDLIVTGSGDPSLGGRFEEDPTGATAVFRRWAGDIRALGVTRIRGAIVGDDRAFDGQREGPGWPVQFRGEWFLPEVSALSFNENCMDVFWRGGRRAGKQTRFTLRPATEYVIFHNGALTGEKGAGAEVSFLREKESNLIRGRGLIPPRLPHHARASVHDPAKFFATVLRETLLAEGIQVEGPALSIGAVKDPQSTTSGTWPVAVHVSPPLSEIMGAANRESHSFYAEMLLKTLGQRRLGKGSFEGGCSAVRVFLKDSRMDDSEITIMDGSGLSQRDSVTPLFMVRLLSFMARHPDAKAYRESLARPGQSGTLRDRFVTARALTPEAAARIAAVTGLPHGIPTLAGYAQSAAGAQFSFYFAVNDPRVPRAEAEALLERLAMTLATSRIRGS